MEESQADDRYLAQRATVARIVDMGIEEVRLPGHYARRELGMEGMKHEDDSNHALLHRDPSGVAAQGGADFVLDLVDATVER